MRSCSDVQSISILRTLNWVTQIVGAALMICACAIVKDRPAVYLAEEEICWPTETFYQHLRAGGVLSGTVWGMEKVYYVVDHNGHGIEIECSFIGNYSDFLREIELYGAQPQKIIRVIP